MRLISDKELGTFFRGYRIKAGFTQLEVAKDFNLKSAQYISNVERGACSIPNWLVKYFVKKYKIPAEVLLKELSRVYKHHWMQTLLVSKPAARLRSRI
jgi:transcriptional regulator with XRE-family HTH domain